MYLYIVLKLKTKNNFSDILKSLFLNSFKVLSLSYLLKFGAEKTMLFKIKFKYFSILTFYNEIDNKVKTFYIGKLIFNP